MATAAPSIQVDGEHLRVHFDRFGIDAYPLFLKVKQLPESSVEFHRDTASYTISAPARFAPMLGVERPAIERDWLPFPAHIDADHDDQQAILRMALTAKRYACWSDCGLGKTIIELEFARQVIHIMAGRVLMFSLNEIVPQIMEECERFYGSTLPILRLESRDEMRAWCKGEFKPEYKLAITNYEKMNHGEDDQVVNELRLLAGVILDESDRLRTGGGKQKWALIKSCKGIPYKLSCTATPAPNEIAEFASQASFLERMRSESDIIWTYFHRDPVSHRWTVKKHARKAFFEFMSSWSIYVRDPRKYGWRKNRVDIPAPEVITHQLPMTEAQRAAQRQFITDKSGQRGLFQVNATNTIQRGKLSQIAKGFAYLRGENGKHIRIDSEKPGYIAQLVRDEVDAGLQVLVWTIFDAESDILSERLTDAGVRHELLTGKTKESQRLTTLEGFRKGIVPVLVSRASMLGFGMNFQCCGSMVFSGWNDSYAAFYQAIRRAVREGQTKRVRVHLPVIEELEGDQLENILHKQDQHEAAIAEMEANYIAAVRRGVYAV